VHAGRLRGLTLALFAAAAVLAVVARKRDAGWVAAIAFACFALGVVAYGAWRRELRARVLDREEKTSK
jgi:hypothetical protein